MTTLPQKLAELRVKIDDARKGCYRIWIDTDEVATLLAVVEAAQALRDPALTYLERPERYRQLDDALSNLARQP